MIEAIARKTQAYRNNNAEHVSRRQRIESEMTGYEGFIFDPREAEDERMTLLAAWYPGYQGVQDVNAELGRLMPDLRESILEFVACRGDFSTHVHQLVYLLRVDADRHFFIAKYYPSPELTSVKLEELYREWVAAECGYVSHPQSDLHGALVSLSEPYRLSVLERWVKSTCEEGKGHEHIDIMLGAGQSR